MLIKQLVDLAETAVQGSLVEMMLRCGKRSCACQTDPGRRHGPALYLKFRNAAGRSTSLYIPRRHEAEARRGVEAWEQLRLVITELTQQNREALDEQVKAKQ